MRELSLHILDIATNSIEANASRVIIAIEEYQSKNLLQIRVRDNGQGMEKEFVDNVLDPFVTTRKTRPVGMGLSLFRQLALQCGGDLTISSTPGRGTLVTVQFQLNHLNRPPIGDVAETIVDLCIGSIDTHFMYIHRTETGQAWFDSYWFLARMAESAKPHHGLAAPAIKVIHNNLTRIHSHS